MPKQERISFTCCKISKKAFKHIKKKLSRFLTFLFFFFFCFSLQQRWNFKQSLQGVADRPPFFIFTDLKGIAKQCHGQFCPSPPPPFVISVLIRDIKRFGGLIWNQISQLSWICGPERCGRKYRRPSLRLRMRHRSIREITEALEWPKSTVWYI